MDGVIREREIITLVLRKYRNLPCLWDRNNEFYTIKTKRNEAYTELLDIYKVLEPKANLFEFKKKLENMRSAYRRMHVKVLRARARKQEFMPTLWYYKEFRFLNELTFDQYSENENVEHEENENDNEETVNEVDCFKTERRSVSPPPIKKRRPNYVYTNVENGEPVNQPDLSTITDQTYDNFRRNNLDELPSAEIFGKTVGAQLNELTPFQRYVAEKLISDVIFYARLDKLCPESTISLNNE